MHANETVLRNVYAAFARGDIPAFLAFCTPDIRFRVPGSGLLGGDHSKEAFLERLGPAMQAVGGSFREEIVNLVADGENGAVLLAQRAERDGVVHRWSCVHWWRFRGESWPSSTNSSTIPRPSMAPGTCERRRSRRRCLRSAQPLNDRSGPTETGSTGFTVFTPTTSR